jgi:hypothetical protein
VAPEITRSAVRALLQVPADRGAGGAGAAEGEQSKTRESVGGKFCGVISPVSLAPINRADEQGWALALGLLRVSAGRDWARGLPRSGPRGCRGTARRGHTRKYNNVCAPGMGFGKIIFHAFRVFVWGSDKCPPIVTLSQGIGQSLSSKVSVGPRGVHLATIVWRGGK